MKSNIITGAVVIGIIALVAIAYQGFVVVPQNKIDAEERIAKEKLSQERTRELVRDFNYEECKREAYQNYSNNWDAKCELIGKEANCSMSGYESAQINQWHKEANEECLAVYKAN